MTLGRTSAGKIKIKTDGTAGLRAVECACCNPSPCGGCKLKEMIPSSSVVVTFPYLTLSAGIKNLQFLFFTDPYSINFIEPFEANYPHAYNIDDCGIAMSGEGFIAGENYSFYLSVGKNGECELNVEVVSTVPDGEGGIFGFEGSKIIRKEEFFKTHQVATLPFWGTPIYVTFS